MGTALPPYRAYERCSWWHRLYSPTGQHGPFFQWLCPLVAYCMCLINPIYQTWHQSPGKETTSTTGLVPYRSSTAVTLSHLLLKSQKKQAVCLSPPPPSIQLHRIRKDRYGHHLQLCSFHQPGGKGWVGCFGPSWMSQVNRSGGCYHLSAWFTRLVTNISLQPDCRDLSPLETCLYLTLDSTGLLFFHPPPPPPPNKCTLAENETQENHMTCHPKALLTPTPNFLTADIMLVQTAWRKESLPKNIHEDSCRQNIYINRPTHYAYATVLPVLVSNSGKKKNSPAGPPDCNTGWQLGLILEQ